MSQGPYSNQGQRARTVVAAICGYEDPSVVATNGTQGVLYVQLGTANVFQKQDDGLTTNWTPFGGGGPTLVDVEENGVPVVSTQTLNFIGATVVDNAGVADITIAGSAPVGNPTQVAFYDGVGNLSAGDAEFFFVDANNILVLGDPAGSYSNVSSRALMIGDGFAVDPASIINTSIIQAFGFTTDATSNVSYSHILGGSNSLNTATINSSAVVGGGTNYSNSQVFNSLIAGASHLGFLFVTNSIVGGYSQSVTTNLENSILSGSGNTIDVANNSILSGSANAITTVLSNSLVTGNNIASSLVNGITNSILCGVSHSLAGSDIISSMLCGEEVIMTPGASIYGAVSCFAYGTISGSVYNSFIGGEVFDMAGSVNYSFLNGSNLTSLNGTIDNSYLNVVNGTYSGNIVRSLVMGFDLQMQVNFTNSLMTGREHELGVSSNFNQTQIFGLNLDTSTANRFFSNSIIVSNSMTFTNNFFVADSFIMGTGTIQPAIGKTILVLDGDVNSSGPSALVHSILNLTGTTTLASSTLANSLALGDTLSFTAAIRRSLAIGESLILNNINQCGVIGLGNNLELCSRTLVVGLTNVIDQLNASIIIGENHTASNFNYVALFGLDNNATRNSQLLTGETVSADSHTLFATGLNNAVLRASDDGLIERTIGGSRIRTRTDNTVGVTIDPRTDYAVFASNGGASNFLLPPGVNGMEFILGSNPSNVAGATIVPDGADTVVGSTVVNTSETVHVVFDSGFWYRIG